MCEKRVEQNILLPILDELDGECNMESMYDYYFTRLDICFDYIIPDGERDLTLVLQHTKNNDIVCFIRMFAIHYRPQDKATERRNEIAEAKLLKYISGSEDLGEEDFYDFTHTCEMCKESQEVYSMLKETWIGETVKTICGLGEMLRQKSEKDENNLFGLLAF